MEITLLHTNVLKAKVSVASTDNLSTQYLAHENQLHVVVGIGDVIWTLIAELECEWDTKPLYADIPTFYVATI